MDSFQDELRTHFAVQLENQHAIDKSQLMVSVIQSDFNKNQINFLYNKRKDHSQIIGLGQFIKTLEKDIPGGILLFFPSYDLMGHILNEWDQAQLKFDRECFQE